jgi:hypothetical protein
MLCKQIRSAATQLNVAHGQFLYQAKGIRKFHEVDHYLLNSPSILLKVNTANLMDVGGH